MTNMGLECLISLRESPHTRSDKSDQKKKQKSFLLSLFCRFPPYILYVIWLSKKAGINSNAKKSLGVTICIGAEEVEALELELEVRNPERARYDSFHFLFNFFFREGP